MGKAYLALVVSIVGLASCSSTPSVWVGNSRCAEFNYAKPGLDETVLLADIHRLLDTPGVALVADYSDRGSFYLTVYITQGRHLIDVREKVSALGWQRVDVIPSSARPGSRVIGNQWSS
jgi:hypothetical protein